MYSKDQKAISIMAKKSVEFNTWVIVMVLVSIRTFWGNIVPNMQKVKKDGINSTMFNNESKKKGYKYIKTHAKHLHSVIFSDTLTDEEKLVELCEIPNIKLVKAGFILQLCLGKVGCIDCHKATKYGTKLSDYKFGPNASLSTKVRKARSYIAECKRQGGSAKLWNSWCEQRYEQYPNTFTSARDVSLRHVDAVVSVAVGK